MTDDKLVKKWRKYFRELLTSEKPEKTIDFNLENRDVQDYAELTPRR